MKVTRVIVLLALMVLMMLATVPVAEAQRACADAYSRCQSACGQRFGGMIFGEVLVGGCVEGCGIGYVWCAASN